MLILGHRGTGITMRETKAQDEARRKAGIRGPENTLRAFELAFKGGADGIEIDVYRTADNDLAVIHDDALNLHVEGADRRRRDRGYVHGHTMDQLRRLKVGDGEPIPSLRDVFALATRYNYPVLNIEVAGKDTYELAYRQAKQSGYPMDRIIFSSFNHDELAKLRALDANVKIGLLFDRQIPLYGPVSGAPLTPAYIDSVMTAIRPTSIHPFISNLSAKILAYAKANGLEIYGWTAREKHPERSAWALNFAKKYANDPHVHLITDHPAALKAAL